MQIDLFAKPLPEGMRLCADLITAEEEAALVARFPELPLKPFEFRNYLGKRRTASFGWSYDYNRQVLAAAADMPDFLAPLRERCAAFAGLAAEDLRHALVTEYEAGAEIGWHRDKPHFDEVIGVSFLTPAPFRFRRKRGAGWERITVPLPPRSAYLLDGPARSEWEHSIPALEGLRYSVTFRRLK